jgi:hypothetical protein
MNAEFLRNTEIAEETQSVSSQCFGAEDAPETGA